MVFKNKFFHLNKNGIFLFDVWYAPAVFLITVDKSKKITEINLNIICRAFFIENNQVNKKYSFFEFDNASNAFNNFEEVHSMRYFTIPEIEYIANSNGFKILSVERTCFFQNLPSLDTSKLNLNLKKLE